jgi:hypothetical protein
MQGMIDMAKSPAEVKKEAKEYAAPDAPAVPIYPYGLCISMDEDVLDKLGLDGDLPEVGEVVHLVCLAKVTCASSREEETTDGQKKTCRRVELQITHLAADGMEDDDDRGEQMRSALYDDDYEDGGED